MCVKMCQYNLINKMHFWMCFFCCNCIRKNRILTFCLAKHMERPKLMQNQKTITSTPVQSIRPSVYPSESNVAANKNWQTKSSNNTSVLPSVLETDIKKCGFYSHFFRLWVFYSFFLLGLNKCELDQFANISVKVNFGHFSFSFFLRLRWRCKKCRF